MYAAGVPPGPALPLDSEHSRPGGTHPKRGQVGYREWCIIRIQSRLCTCLACNGALTDPELSTGGWGFCRRCRCAHKIQVAYGRRQAAWIPAYGRCANADRMMAEEQREQERQASRRLVAEKLGAAQR